MMDFLFDFIMFVGERGRGVNLDLLRRQTVDQVWDMREAEMDRRNSQRAESWQVMSRILWGQRP